MKNVNKFRLVSIALITIAFAVFFDGASQFIERETTWLEVIRDFGYSLFLIGVSLNPRFFFSNIRELVSGKMDMAGVRGHEIGLVLIGLGVFVCFHLFYLT